MVFQESLLVYEYTNLPRILSNDDAPAPSIAPTAVLIYSGQTNSTGYLEETVRILMHLASVQVSQFGINNRVSLDTNPLPSIH
jgi:hypothetical protein